jgi:hypothetical protein
VACAFGRMRTMVMLARGWQQFVALLSAVIAFGRSADSAVVAHDAHDDETAEEEAAAVLPAQSVEQAPLPAPSMPIGHRYVHAEPQNYRRTPQDDSWWMGTPRVLLDSLANDQ